MNVPLGPILIVEDITNVRDFLEITLRFKGYPVVTAVNGQEALEIAAREPPALVITDILMPKMDGYTLAYNLRRNPLTSHIPIIVISATYVSPEDKAFALSLGVVRFIEKPIDTEDFLLTVAEVLLAQESEKPASPPEERAFYAGYRVRLENKLRYKNGQIARTERLLATLSEDQRPAFEVLMAQAISDRDDIRAELEQLNKVLNEE